MQKLLSLEELKERLGFDNDKDFFYFLWSGNDEIPKPFYKLEDIERMEELNKNHKLLGFSLMPLKHEMEFLRKINDSKSKLQQAEENFEKLYGYKPPIGEEI